MGDNDKTSRITYDIIVIGAGISGINAAYRIQKELPLAKYMVIESRGCIRGTWDLFRYPGFRSDSDLYTFGFAWRPWAGQKAIFDGESIRKLVSADWSSDQQTWSLQVDKEGQGSCLHARFVILCTGYYDYEEALSSVIPDIGAFEGTTIHPQFWPSNFDHKGKRMVVVGSGSTAVTLIPALAETAAHVTMLQRSPGYIVARPAVDPFGQWVKRLLPSWIAHRIIRVKFLILSLLFIKFCSIYPHAARNLIKKATLKQLLPEVPHDPHFEPQYNPWEQRLCLCPDGDFFKAMRAGKASVVTDTISSVTKTGIQLASGLELPADVIVTATGLKLKMAGGARISVDSVPVAFGEKFLWKGIMLQDLPNMAVVIGYTNASWTLGADATALLVCRIFKSMRNHGLAAVGARLDPREVMNSVPALNITSTYVVRGKNKLPRTGDKAPWRPRSTYLWDLWNSKFGNISDELKVEKISK